MCLSVVLYLKCVITLSGVVSALGDWTQQYIGCYRDVWGDRAMGECIEKSSSMSLERCAQRCENLQTTYFGVQNSDECFCGHRFNKHGPAANCNGVCMGNRVQICGGYHALSVYWVCPAGYYGSNCSVPCGADCGSFCFMNGTCQCPTGWTGVTCQTDVDECKRGYCQQTCANTAGSFTCGCRSGYTLDNNKRNCTDNNECSSAATNSCTQICINTVGSYTCSCSLGFTMDRDGRTCNDVDECKTKTHGCQHNCTNTPGSYSCSCLPGFTLDGSGKICSQALTVNRTTTVTPTAVPDSNAKANLLLLLLLLLLLPVVICGLLYVLIFRRRRIRNPKSQRQIPAPDVTVLPDNDDVSYVLPLPTESVENRKSTTVSTKSTKSRHSGAAAPINPVVSGIGSTSRIHLNELATLVACINKTPTYLQDEFAAVPMAADLKCDFAQKPELKRTNRFKNIVPYDTNRVILSELNGDPLTTYINASFVKGFDEEEKLIACQGPSPYTINDFWRMIWEYNVGVVVMVTKCVEVGKTRCERYWPEMCVMEFGGIKVKPLSTLDKPSLVTRIFSVSMDGVERILTQIQFTDWPDHGVPEHAVSVLAIRHAVKRIIGRDQYIVVHCSAGAGRTGTYLAIDFLLSQADKKDYVDVYGCMKALREQRMQAVQTLDQYSFIFKAIHERRILGETTLSFTEFQQRISQLKSDDSIIHIEFRILQEMLPLRQQSHCDDALNSQNRNKNRDLKLAPADSQRVILGRSKHRTDYINAVFVPSFKRKKGFVTTQLPLDSTVGDFWDLILDYNCPVVVFLSNPDKAEDIFGFLPKRGGDSLQFDKTRVSELNELATRDSEACQMFSVVCSRADKRTSARLSKGKPTENIYANTTPDARVKIIQIVLPIDQRMLPKALIEARLVVDNATLGLPSDPDSPSVVVMSRDGVVHCGQFIAVCNLCDMINTQQEVDVFQTVYNIKRAQPHFFTNMDDYRQLYNAAEVFYNFQHASPYCNTE